MTLFATSIYWDLPVLLIVVSLVYSGTRHDRWDRILVEAAGWIVRITGFLAMLGGALYVLSTYVEWRYYLMAAMAAALVAYTLVTNYLMKPKPKPATSPPAKDAVTTGAPGR